MVGQTNAATIVKHELGLIPSDIEFIYNAFTHYLHDLERQCDEKQIAICRSILAKLGAPHV